MSLKSFCTAEFHYGFISLQNEGYDVTVLIVNIWQKNVFSSFKLKIFLFTLHSQSI